MQLLKTVIGHASTTEKVLKSVQHKIDIDQHKHVYNSEIILIYNRYYFNMKWKISSMSFFMEILYKSCRIFCFENYKIIFSDSLHLLAVTLLATNKTKEMECLGTKCEQEVQKLY